MSHGPQPSGTRLRASRLRRWLADPLTSVLTVLALVPWLVQPGVIEPDTKVDLVVSPMRYLTRALHAWSGHSGFGELQNQAYGYLFPMGSFFAVAEALGVPGWAAQRAWWSLLLVVGAAGAALFARRVVGLGTPAAALVGVLYALSPRVLSLIAQLSIETWPAMVMPWLLLAVHARARGGLSWRRYVGVTGVLCAALGGVNATASLVAVLGAFVLALFRASGNRPRRDVLAGLILGAVLGCAWWLGPLVVLGGYAYPFMDYIETSRITTAVTSVPGILRGASDWVAYIIDAEGHPVWQSGWVVAQGTASIVAGCVLAGVGLYGLMGLRDAGERRARDVLLALATMLVLGVLGMGVAYVGAVHGPFASGVRSLLDGPLAAARNVHKLDPLVRLPLVVGVGVVGERLLDSLRRRQEGARSAVTPLAAAAMVVAVLASMAPFWQGRLGEEPGVRAWPDSLRATAADIDAAAARDGGATLVLPSARAATYEWGTTSDEPLGAFATSPVAVRASAPLVHPGAQRLMDSIDAHVAAGHDLEAVAASLQRAGVKRVVVRHGLTAAQQTTPATRYVASLSDSAAFTHHRIHGSGSSRFDVFDVTAPIRDGAASAPVGVLGGPESTLTLAAAGVLPQSPLITGRTDGWITDDVRKRVYNNGRPASLAFGPTLSANSTADERLGARDLIFEGRDVSLTTMDVDGVADAGSAVSASDPFGDLYLGPGAGPSAALDVSDSTAWLTPAAAPSPLVLTLRGDEAPGRATVTGAEAEGGVLRGLSVTADKAPVQVTRQGANEWTFDLPRGTHTLALQPQATSRSARSAVGIAAVRPAQGDWLAIARLPGIVDPGTNGVVMTRSRPFAQGQPLRSEDDGVWARRIHVATSGSMSLDVRFTPDAPRTAAPHVWIRSNRGPWQPVPLSGSHGNVTLPRGLVDIKLSPDVEGVRLLPTSATARQALGLGGTISGADDRVVMALTSGANAGWRCEPGNAHPVTLDGWRQGCAVTARGDAGRDVRLTFAPQVWHERALIGGGLAFVLAALLLVVPSRRRSGDSSPAERTIFAAERAHAGTVRTAARAGACALAALIAVVLAGWWAVPVLLAATLIPERRRRATALGLLCVTGPLMAAFGVVDKASLGALGGQLLAVTALTVFVCEVAGAPSGWRVVRRTANSRSPERA